MKSKKVYIGIIAIVLFCIVMVASIFYIKANNKDVKISKFLNNFTNENTKEAMNETEKLSQEINTNKKEELVVKINVETEDIDYEQIKEVQSSEAEKSDEQTKNQNMVTNEPLQSVEESSNLEETTNNQVAEPKKEIVVTPMEKTLYVNIESLNVRSGPDTSYDKIGVLKKCAELKITGKSSGWYRIEYNNKTGFVNGSYLSETKPVIETPKVEENTDNSSVTVSNISQTTESVQNNGLEVLNNLIIVNSRNNTLRYYTSGKLSRSYSCATGASSSPTPQGKFSICNKIKNRPYYKLNIPGGAPNNPLGKRWLGLQVNGTNGNVYAIHGNNDESSIGKSVSKGCIRMHNAEIEEFYDIVPIGTTVIIKNTSQTDKQIAESYNIYID